MIKYYINKDANYCGDLSSGNVVNDYPIYAAAVADGTKAAPNVNGDGKLDAEDIDDIMDYIYYHYSASELFDNLVPKGLSKLTPAILDYLSTDFDVNNNGLSCDWIDSKVASIYILNHSECSFDEIVANSKYNIFEMFASSAIVDNNSFSDVIGEGYDARTIISWLTEE